MADLPDASDSGAATSIAAPIPISEDTARRGAFREVMVDFFGSLIPGVVLILGLVPALLMPVGFSIILLYPAYGAALFESNPVFENLAGADPNIPNSTIFLILVIIPALFLFFVLAYVAGHIFFRQGPKVPDTISFLLMDEQEQEQSMVGHKLPLSRWKKLQLWLGVKDIDPEAKKRVQFPYPDLRGYLSHRGLVDLASMIPWSKEDEEHREGRAQLGAGGQEGDAAALGTKRAKHFINALKIRLEFLFPERMATIAKNEAHVRLSSSMWYVSRIITGSSILGLLLVFGAVVALPTLPLGDTVFTIVAVGSIPIGCGYLGHKARRGIEHALHYQREREVLFILETAHWANRVLKVHAERVDVVRRNAPSSPSVDIFEGLGGNNSASAASPGSF